MSFQKLIEIEISDMLTSLVEEKDTYTGGHSKRVALYASKIGEAVGLDKIEQEILYYSSLLHDIGKILTPDSILLKPTRFSRYEYDIIKKHSTDSEKMVGFLSPFQKYRKFIRHHHERYDGKGYPDGLKGEEIPFFSRIIAIADSFDAMTTSRIYKHKKTRLLAMQEIEKFSGTQFDPNLVPIALEVFRTINTIDDNSQAPTTFLDEQRYAFYFKDRLTSVYSAKYLDCFLEANLYSKDFKCCYFIQLHNMHNYNKYFGWNLGNQVLIEIALRIKIFFKSSFIFRVYGDDFVVLNKQHADINQDEVLKKLTIGFNPISASFRHFDLYETQIVSWETLEKYLD
jgi:putative nucleotidyltransferase with HDIG domain